MSKKKVAYYYDADVGNYHYGVGHMMKPHRIRMAHNLMVNYGLYKKMQIFKPGKASETEMTKFHADDYIDFLKNVTPDNMHTYSKQLQRFNIGDDCPIFDGMYQYCQISAGGSIGGAVKLNTREADIAINWAGGLHHAKKSEASGFCYVNDIVLAILELLKHHQRVLYLDIDVHHGDGVEEAFYTTDRVMTVSFHQFGDFFPGTGDPRDVGIGKGKNYAVNVPLKIGIDDESYQSIFKPIMQAVIEWYRPEAMVIQCGADSLYGDRLGSFNLTERGHAECISFLKKFNVPLLVLGGGGYTIKNVARCWVYETAVVLDTEIANELPYNDYLEHYGPEYTLHITPSNMENQNSREYLEKCKNTVLQRLRRLHPSPSVSRHDIPPDSVNFSENEEEEDPDAFSVRDEDSRIQPDNEIYDSDDEYAERNIDTSKGYPRPTISIMNSGKNSDKMLVDP